MVRTKALEIEDRRISALLTLGELYRDFKGADIAANVIRSGGGVQEFTKAIMPAIEAQLQFDRGLGLDMFSDEMRGYSLVRLVQSMIPGSPSRPEAGFEREVSREMEKRVGKPPNGVYVPLPLLLRDFNVGTAAESGNLVQTSVAGERLVDPLRNNLVLAKMGAMVVAGLRDSVNIPRISATSSGSFQTEIAAGSESNPNTSLVSLSPKRVTAFVEPSRQAMLQATPILEKMLRDELMGTIAVQIQDAAINGSGSGANPRGIRNTSGVGSVAGGANGAQVAWSHLLDLESACANADAEPSDSATAGYVTNPKVRRWSKNTAKGTNQPFLWGDGSTPVNGYRAGVTRTVPSNLTKGTSTTVCSSILFSSDWAQLIIGIFGAPDINVNPYTLATAGQVRITVNTFMDVGVLQPAAFALMDDALTA